MLVHYIYFVTLLMVSENAEVQEAEKSTREYEPTQVLSPFSAELCKTTKYFYRGRGHRVQQLVSSCMPSWVVTFFWSLTACRRWAATCYNQGRYFVGCINVQINYKRPSLFTATFWIIYDVRLVSPFRHIERNGKLIFLKDFNFCVAFAVLVDFV